MATASIGGPSNIGGGAWTTPALRWSVRALTAVVWASSAIFGIYIIAWFLGAVVAGTPAEWNESLPELYVPRSFAANLGIGVHFALGAVLLLLGPIQLMGRVRARWPRFHRWVGWIYAVSALVTGLGGLAFILTRGTIGGTTMDVGFGLYGALMVLAAVQTLRHAIARRLEIHRAWAIRLFALAIGSWLYRMDYGFWMLFAGRLGHTSTFDGWFDVFMIFWFYVPNLIVAEAFIRARRPQASNLLKGATATVLTGASLFLLLATWFFTTEGWGPVIVARFGGGPA